MRETLLNCENKHHNIGLFKRVGESTKHFFQGRMYPVYIINGDTFAHTFKNDMLFKVGHENKRLWEKYCDTKSFDGYLGKLARKEPQPPPWPHTRDAEQDYNDFATVASMYELQKEKKEMVKIEKGITLVDGKDSRELSISQLVTLIKQTNKEAEELETLNVVANSKNLADKIMKLEEVAEALGAIIDANVGEE